MLAHVMNDHIIFIFISIVLHFFPFFELHRNFSVKGKKNYNNMKRYNFITR